jgi:hypothetical protein
LGRRFRLWEKKRGNRLTAPQSVGTAGEAMFFTALLLFGVLTLFVFLRSDYSDLSAGGLSRVWSWLILLVLASLTLIGLVGSIYSVVLLGTSAERRRALAKRATDIDLLTDRLSSPRDFPNVPRDQNLTNSPGIRLAYRLPITQSPGLRLLMSGVFTVLWNGMVAILAWIAARDYLAGHPDWYLVALAVPFGLIGLAAIVHFSMQLLLATAIGPTSVELSRQPMYPGQSYHLFLSQAGRLSVRSLTVTLVCVEEATYRQGTDTRTERRRVHQEQLFRKENFQIEPSAPFEHESILQFPGRVMHSFQSDHNAVHWMIVVEGVVEKWSNFERKFPLLVYPLQLPNAKSNGQPVA